MTADTLKFLTNLYERQCDQDWEHSYGIEIRSVGADGWTIRVDVNWTELEGLDRDWTSQPATLPGQWIRWRATGRSFEATCEPSALGEAVQVFHQFAGGAHATNDDADHVWRFLGDWLRGGFDSVADPVVEIRTLDNPGWWTVIRTSGTALERVETDWVQTERSETDWLHWRVAEGTFTAACGPLNLAEALATFRTLADRGGWNPGNDPR